MRAMLHAPHRIRDQQRPRSHPIPGVRMYSVDRYHDISCGHRVFGHESKCAHLHGHNYRIHFTIEPDNRQLDLIGRVLDFSVIKTRLCEWLEKWWDHKMLIWV